MFTKNIEIHQKIDLAQMIKRFFYHHPYISYSIMLIGMPIAILLIGCLFATVVMLPVSMLFGWI